MLHRRRQASELVIFPVPNYKLKSFSPDPRWKDEYVEAARAEIEAFNRMVTEQIVAIAVPDNHAAVRAIREIYPEFVAPADWFLPAHQSHHPGDWYERYAEQPTPENCEPPSRLGAHRSDGWCQFCGHTAQAKEIPQ